MTSSEREGWLCGDERTVRLLIARESPRLLAAALALTRDRTAAEELAHDTWVRAFERRTTYDGRGSFGGWLLAICRTTFCDARRRARPFVAVATEAPETPMIPADPAEASDRRARLVAALAQLPPRQRDVLLARLVDDRSTRETAQLLGIAEGTVKATLAAALRNLRPLLLELRP